MILTIAIPTLEERKAEYAFLKASIMDQIKKLGVKDVEVISMCDDRELTIGEKRQKLYEMARGEWTVQVDDDDQLASDYLYHVLPALGKNPDCVGYKEAVDFKGKARRISRISLEYTEWKTNKPSTIDVMYERSPFFKVPIRTELCRQAGVPFLRFAEDIEFAKRIRPLLTTEVFIDEFLYIYNTQTMTREEMGRRYGI